VRNIVTDANFDLQAHFQAIVTHTENSL